MENILSVFDSTMHKVIFIVVLALGAHILVLVIHKIEKFILKKFTKKRPKWNSIRTLGFSLLIFALYFVAFGKILSVMGISLTAYLATASVIGLAVGFGTQGIIQDVITGITIVLTEMFDIGDLVEVNGVVGIVKCINMRFVEIEDQHGTKAFIPNKTISKVVNFPKGYLSCSVDFTMNGHEISNDLLFAEIEKITKSLKEQYPKIFRGPISINNNKETSSGKKFTRIKLRIWPGRSNLIEGVFKAELLTLLKANNPDYKDWMVAVNYEVENGRKIHKT